MTDRTLRALAAAVTDGERIEWRAIVPRLAATRARAVAVQLQALSEIAHSAAASTRPVPAERLPLVLDLIVVLAGGMAILGALGMLSGPALTRRDVMPLVLLTAFGLAALLRWGTRDGAASALAGAYACIAAAFAVRGTDDILQTLTPRVAAALDALRPEAFLPAFFWFFAREFPAPTRFGRIERLCSVALAGSIVVGILLFAANVLPPVLGGSGRIASSMESLDRLRGNGDAFWGLVFAFTLPALLVLPLRARSVATPERQRVRQFLLGIAFGLAPVVVAVLSEALIPSFARAMDDTRYRAWVAWVVYPPLVAMPAITAHGVAAHDVLRPRAIVRQGLQHLLARWLVACATVAAATILTLYVTNRRDQPIGNLLSETRPRMLLVIVVTGMLVLVFRAQFSRTLDRWLVPGADESAAVLARLTEDLGSCRTTMELANTVAPAATRGLQTRTHVFLVDGDRLRPFADSVEAPSSASLIAPLARGSARPVIVEPSHPGSHYRLLTAADRNWIDAHHIGAIVPLVRRRTADGVFAILAVESRRTKLRFSADDLQFLATAAASVSVAAGGLDDATAATSEDEQLAIQCLGCWRIERWRPQPELCACGSSWETAALPPILFGRFILECRLGAGGMGVVYRARDAVLGRLVAIKTLPQLKAESAERLIGEARAMAALSHPHIATLYGTDAWRDTPVLLMEYLEGGTLSTRLRVRPLLPTDAVRMIEALAGALDHLHESGQYHGDIKPSNIGFSRTGVVKLLDFGLSLASEHAGAARAGTLAYLSPEALRREAAGPHADLWSLAVVLFESLTGTHPFMDGRQTAWRIKRGLSHGTPALNLTPPALRSFLSDALARDRARRPRTAAEMIVRLSALHKQLS